jgi:hypothetical protein
MDSGPGAARRPGMTANAQRTKPHHGEKVSSDSLPSPRNVGGYNDL